MEDIIVTVLVALSSVAAGFLGGIIAKGRESIKESSNKIDDKILEIIDLAIAKSKEEE